MDSGFTLIFKFKLRTLFFFLLFLFMLLVVVVAGQLVGSVEMNFTGNVVNSRRSSRPFIHGRATRVHSAHC